MRLEQREHRECIWVEAGARSGPAFAKSVPLWGGYPIAKINQAVEYLVQ
jgi:hypothetical protein